MFARKDLKRRLSNSKGENYWIGLPQELVKGNPEEILHRIQS